MSKTVLFQTIQFSLSTLFSSIQPIDWTLSGAITPSQDDNEGVLRIPQNSNITEASPSEFIVPYPGHSAGKSHPSAEVQSVYSTTPADWANF